MIILTGHTRGLGKALYETFSLTDKVYGLSRSNGYDIGNIEHIDKIYDDYNHCDVLINNAYHPTGQFNVLQKFYSGWLGKNKKIININSVAIFQNENDMSHIVYGYPFSDYHKTKTEMKKFFNDNIFNDSPTIVNVVVGLLDTFDVQKPKMNTIEIANYIKMLTFNDNGFTTKEVVLMPKKENA